MKSHRFFILLISILGLTLFSCENKPEAEKGSIEHIKNATMAINAEVLNNANTRKGDWLSYGRNYQEDRYSELDQINKENAKNLGLAWSADLGTSKGLQATPIVVDGILFFSGPFNVVYAYDARTGKEIWQYDAKFDTDKNIDLCCSWTNRGLAIYEGDLFMGTLDGRLISINAATGTLNWEVLTIPENSAYTITGAPRVVKGNVLIGNGGAEANARGYISAYNTKNGELSWRFYTVPGNPSEDFEHPDLEEAAKTWTGEWWKQGGGGTVWDSFVYDPELNLVYIGVGNGSHWDREIRSPEGGDNLYLSSIVALNADDGSYQWHFQTTPGDSWDYTATQPIILADLTIEGKERKVLMQAPKNGYFYVIDRTNGEFISANNFVYQNWTTGVDENGRPIEAEGARYTDGKVHWIAPSSHGGHNWPPMSYNQKNGLVYIPTANNTDPYMHNADAPNDPKAFMGGIGSNVALANKLYLENVVDTHPDAPKPGLASGRLVAWDPVAQSEVWGVNQKSLFNGGLLSTSTGLLLQGDAEGIFSVRDADNGKVLKQFDLRSGIVAPPVTYLVDGQQYISILVGWGGMMAKFNNFTDHIYPGTLYTFNLGGKAEFPEKFEIETPQLTSRTPDATEAEIGNGWNTFSSFCIACHTFPGNGSATVPDLARSKDAVFDIYPAIIKDGVYAVRGMPGMGDRITLEQIEDVKQFVYYCAEQYNNGKIQPDLMPELARMQQKADSK